MMFYESLTREIGTIMSTVDSYLIWKNQNQPHRGYTHYHPSAMGKCLRLMQYQRYADMGLMKVEKKDLKASVIRIFDTGHSMHDRWRDYFEQLGVLKGYWTCTNTSCGMFSDDGVFNKPNTDDIDWGYWVKKQRKYGRDQLQGCFKPEKCVCGWNRFHYDEVDVKDTEMNIFGHADMVVDFTHLDKSKITKEMLEFLNLDDLPKKPIVIDMKTINEFDFKKMANTATPHHYYLVQLMIYANVLDCDYGLLIYENKNNQTTQAFKVFRRADDLFQTLKNQARLMNEMAEVVDDNGNRLYLLPPPRPLSKDEKDCEYCEYKNFCHASSAWQDPELNEKRKAFYGNLL